jgi:hypothetical protein
MNDRRELREQPLNPVERAILHVHRGNANQFHGTLFVLNEAFELGGRGCAELAMQVPDRLLCPFASGPENVRFRGTGKLGLTALAVRAGINRENDSRSCRARHDLDHAVNRIMPSKLSK